MTHPTDEHSPWDPLRECIEHLRRQPPRPGFPRKTITQLGVEQGVGPINAEEILAIVQDASREDLAFDVRDTESTNDAVE